MLRVISSAVVLCAAIPAWGAVHVWEKQEITLTAARTFANPYTDVTVWVDLTPAPTSRNASTDSGTATALSVCVWWPLTPEPECQRSGSDPADTGLAGQQGAFSAIVWTEAEKRQNPVRRGFLRSTPNHHALEQADGTPFFILGDTWWATGTNCFRWYDDDRSRPIGPTRRLQGLCPLSESARLQPGSASLQRFLIGPTDSLPASASAWTMAP